MVEMAIRAYDHCFSCMTHTLPSQMPMEIVIKVSAENTINVMKQNFWT